MRFFGSSFVFAGLVLVACGGASATGGTVGSQTGALGTYRDGCDANACGARPAPQHRCAGGFAVSVCTKARGTCGWQIDCADEPPPEYDGNVGVSSCDVNTTAAQACGPLPVYDDKDCVYGFIGEPQCERYGNASCAWSHRCRPRPCEQTGTCNVLDRSKLGGTCDAESPCPTGSSCASINVNIGEHIPPTCVEGDACSALTCAAGLQCYVRESYPLQVGCGR
ncbi:MAG: hypothetical protein KF764_30795 [Labilithrix sp.]|nr:hypothetical protein [Labilithrix sp.]